MKIWKYRIYYSSDFKWPKVNKWIRRLVLWAFLPGIITVKYAERAERKEAGLEICRQLSIDPSRVLSIDIFALHGTLVVKTLDGDVLCTLVPERDKDNELVLRIVRDDSVGEKA